MSGDPMAREAPLPRLNPCWPILPGPRYRGVVWNHPRLRDGTLITTSAIVELRGGRIVTRSGSTYELGRTFLSEQHALRHVSRAIGATQPAPAPPPQDVPVLDLESDDPAELETIAHQGLPELR
jgi:hypothetical protein